MPFPPQLQVLYPLGVGSELAMVALALPTIRANRPLSIQVGPAAHGSAAGCRLLMIAPALLPARHRRPVALPGSAHPHA